MGWVERKLDYAGGRLEGSVEHAAEKHSGVIEQGIDKAGAELRDVLREGSREIDTKLDKISQELSNQRSFTKNDVRELVDYATVELIKMEDVRIFGNAENKTGVISFNIGKIHPAAYTGLPRDILKSGKEYKICSPSILNKARQFNRLRKATE